MLVLLSTGTREEEVMGGVGESFFTSRGLDVDGHQHPKQVRGFLPSLSGRQSAYWIFFFSLSLKSVRTTSRLRGATWKATQKREYAKR